MSLRTLSFYKLLCGSKHPIEIFCHMKLEADELLLQISPRCSLTKETRARLPAFVFGAFWSLWWFVQTSESGAIPSGACSFNREVRSSWLDRPFCNTAAILYPPFVQKSWSQRARIILYQFIVLTPPCCSARRFPRHPPSAYIIKK